MTNDTRTAKAILAKLVEQENDIDDLMVIFTRKDANETIAMGMTDHSTTSWYLGALEWAKWYIYDTMSTLKRAGELAEAIEAQIMASIKDKGGLN